MMPAASTMERKVYKVWCPTPSHRREWAELPQGLAGLPLLATGAPGPNPQIVAVLRQCPRCVVRLMAAR